MSLRKPIPQAVADFWITGQVCCGRGYLLLLSLLPSQAGRRMRGCRKASTTCASCSAVWRGQAEREQQQAKQLEQQLRETQGSTQTLEQQASVKPVSLVGGYRNPAGICSIGSIC